jgi:hypothetical protein
MVRTINPGGIRGSIYDRRATTISLTYAASVAGPYAETTVATYTVPTARKAALVNVSARMTGAIVATMLSYEAVAVAPHGTTTRATYTTPTGRQAMIATGGGTVTRQTAGGAIGLVRARIVPGINHLWSVTMWNNAVSALTHGDVPAGGIALAGGTISLTTDDTTTGGTVAYNLGFQIVEFDPGV